MSKTHVYVILSYDFLSPKDAGKPPRRGLLLNGKWGLPEKLSKYESCASLFGGKMEAGEDTRTAIRRELYSEEMVGLPQDLELNVLSVPGADETPMEFFHAHIGTLDQDGLRKLSNICREGFVLPMIGDEPIDRFTWVNPVMAEACRTALRL